MKCVKTYASTNGDVIRVEGNKLVPCLLFVTEERLPSNGGIKITISGKKNPFPFRVAVIPRYDASLSNWLLQHGYTEIGRNYVQ